MSFRTTRRLWVHRARHSGFWVPTNCPVVGKVTVGLVCVCVCVVYQVEIDEFQNYEKALGALGEAYKVLSSDQSNSQNELKLSDLKNRMTLVKAFIDAKSYV